MPEGIRMEVEWIRKEWKREHELALALHGLSDAQRETLRRLDRHWALKGHSFKTRTHKLRNLRLFGLSLSKPFEAVERNDLEVYLGGIQQRCRPSTLEDHKRILKSVYKDLLNPDEPGHPAVVRWLRLANPFKETKTHEDLLTVDEIRRMAEVATNARDRALLLLLDESGARATEVAALRIADVKFDEYGALVTLGGDTDKRRVRLLQSVPDLTRWLNEHPFRREPESPLWVSWGSANRLEALGQHGIANVVEQAAKVARIEKHVHPHLFRHTRINVWLDKYNDDVVKYLAGWSKNSAMVSVYRHRAGKRYDRVILEAEGLLDPHDAKEPQTVKSQTCARCRAVNSAVDRYCRTCTLPLSEDEIRKALRAQELVEKYIPALERLMQDPDIGLLIAKKVNEAKATTPKAMDSPPTSPEARLPAPEGHPRDTEAERGSRPGPSHEAS